MIIPDFQFSLAKIEPNLLNNSQKIAIFLKLRFFLMPIPYFLLILHLTKEFYRMFRLNAYMAGGLSIFIFL